MHRTVELTDSLWDRLDMSDGKEPVRSQRVILHQHLISKDGSSMVLSVDALQRGRGSKMHGFDCSQKHAYRAPDRQRSDIWGQSVTLVMSPDRAGSSCCFDSADYGPPGTETKLGLFLRTCQLNCHFKIWRQRKTSKCLKTLMTFGLLFKSYYC